ncbi:acyl-CoA dehydrogenase domain-containing protein [Salinicola tamaricis]|uniref:acyl-CoA dehydrogenase domain-containing protein n=1 Tax=Salinicola tamaricis TaxID=1771309 RepID=UPI0024145247|nr:acyl-CoA dehydrogenase domain-containing protein [Salinicola tamaricis]
MASLGAKLKQREMISARLGDVLSNLYLLCRWCSSSGTTVTGWTAKPHCSTTAALFLLNRAEQALVELYENLPNRALAHLLAGVTMPLGRRWHKPQDSLTRDIAKAISTDTALRHKLTRNTWDSWEEGQQDNPLARYNALLANAERAERDLPHAGQGAGQA